jgi:drug/metabolite transporter (DMT)-like permease
MPAADGDRVTASTAPPLSANAVGALWMLASVAGATGMTLAIRVLTPELHSSMIAFLRSAFGLVLVLPFLWRARAAGTPLRFAAWKLHLARGALIAVALNAGFYAIWQLPMAQATILFFMAPVFATAMAMAAFGERVGPRRWAAIAVGFLGALVILRPGIVHVDLGMIAALVSSLCFAAALMIGRALAARDGADSIFVSSSVLTAVGTLPPALLVWDLPGDALAWAVLGGLVLFSALRQYADIRAYAVGEAGFLAPFTYLRLLTVGVAGYVWFGEVLDRATIAGGAVIVAATLYISLREAQLKRAGAAARAP